MTRTPDPPELLLFSGHISYKVARALIRGGITTPEQLLLTDIVVISVVPGVGPIARREIEAYRSRHRRKNRVIPMQP